MNKRNPSWNYDELIVALDFYLQHAPDIPIKKSTEIVELRGLLSRLQHQRHGTAPDKFRNVNSVYMNLMNFCRFDPNYTESRATTR